MYQVKTKSTSVYFLVTVSVAFTEKSTSVNLQWKAAYDLFILNLMINAINYQNDLQMLNFESNTVFVFYNKMWVVSHNEIIGDFPRISSWEGFHLISTVQYLSTCSILGGFVFSFFQGGISGWHCLNSPTHSYLNWGIIPKHQVNQARFKRIKTDNNQSHTHCYLLKMEG